MYKNSGEFVYGITLIGLKLYGLPKINHDNNNN